MKKRLITFSMFVPGSPAPAGSKTARATERSQAEQLATGRRFKTWVQDSCKRSPVWKNQVRQEAQFRLADLGFIAPLWDEAISARFLFLVERPKSHLRADGSLKPSAPRHPVAKPDCLKLARAAEDALSGVVYWDDARIIDEWIGKRYVGEFGCDRAGMLVHIRPYSAKDQMDLHHKFERNEFVFP